MDYQGEKVLRDNYGTVICMREGMKEGMRGLRR